MNAAVSVRALYRVLVLSIFTLGASVDAGAQVRSHGYVVGAFGGGTGVSSMTQVGVGINKVWPRGFSLGTEAGYASISTSDIGFWSFNIAQHLRTTSRNSPFVTGGLSVIGYGGGFNFGAGVHRSLNERVGVRMEFRQYLL